MLFFDLLQLSRADDHLFFRYSLPWPMVWTLIHPWLQITSYKKFAKSLQIINVKFCFRQFRETINANNQVFKSINLSKITKFKPNLLHNFIRNCLLSNQVCFYLFAFFLVCDNVHKFSCMILHLQLCCAWRISHIFFDILTLFFDAILMPWFYDCFPQSIMNIMYNELLALSFKYNTSFFLIHKESIYNRKDFACLLKNWFFTYVT